MVIIIIISSSSSRSSSSSSSRSSSSSSRRSSRSSSSSSSRSSSSSSSIIITDHTIYYVFNYNMATPLTATRMCLFARSIKLFTLLDLCVSSLIFSVSFMDVPFWQHWNGNTYCS